MKTERLFAAVFLNPETSLMLEERVQVQAAHYGISEVRWIPRENFHLTLCFLGSTSSERAPELGRIVEEEAGLTRPFKVRFQETGIFPESRSKRARIPSSLWLGIQEGREALSELAIRLQTRLLGPPERRPFVPHLTLGRAKKLSPHAEQFWLGLGTSGELEVETSLRELVLARSLTHARGAEYEKLLIAAFKG